jgi:hypothetical protein
VVVTVFLDADAVVFVSCTRAVSGPARQLRVTLPDWLVQAKTAGCRSMSACQWDRRTAGCQNMSA